MMAPRYQKATGKEKPPILNEFVAATGYHRKYAIGLLGGYPFEPKVSLPQRQAGERGYPAEVREALIIVWEAANRICSKRLVPFLPELVAVLEQYGHLSMTPAVKERLLGISPATVDRLLAEVRRAGQGAYQRKTTPSSFLKQQVPIRTFSEWEGARPGYMEIDLVAHGGSEASGSYWHTLTMTDVVTGWTECVALLFRDQHLVLQAIRQVEERLPVPLLAIDTDNGSEFLNRVLFEYCRGKPIIFTRSRPYKKNDQCYVEQKNGAIVRQFIGYDRFEGVEPGRILTELYRQLRLYVNFFQPSLKLLSKKRERSRVIKTYDPAQTPYQRVLAAESVSAEIKEQLRTQFGSLDPVRLLMKIQTLQDELWGYAQAGRASCQLPTHDLPVGIISQRQLAKPMAQANGTGVQPNGQDQIITPVVEPRPCQRKYRPSKQRRGGQGQRWWRTRQDPFAEVWPEAAQQLAQRPDLSAKVLFEALQREHPGKFNEGMLRTLQRRVRTWRTAYIAGQSEPEQVLVRATEGGFTEPEMPPV